MALGFIKRVWSRIGAGKLDPRGPNKFEPQKHEPFPGQNPPAGDHDKQDRKRRS